MAQKRTTLARRPKAKPPGTRRQNDPHALSLSEKQFILEYQANGGNATRAYLLSHPLCQSHNAAAVGGNKLLRKSKVAEVIAKAQEARWKALEMQADEAVALTAYRARMDILDAYDPETGVMLPLHLWPERLRKCVKGIKPGAFGDTIILTDPQHATETVLTMTGRLKNKLDLNLQFDHAGYLAGNDSPDE